MKFSMEIPLGDVTPDEFQNATAVREMVAALEAAGVDACSVTDHPAPSSEWLHQAGLGHDALDPFAALSFVAAASKTIMLHTAIVVLPYRNPFITAKAAATVQVLSNGRLILGAAPGYQKIEFEALGVDFHKRGVLMDEALETIRLAWGGGSVVKVGRSFNATGNESRPVPDPLPPIWIGGASDPAIRRAARSGDGWCPVFSDPRQSQINRDAAINSIDHLRERLGEINVMRQELGRTGPFDVAIRPRELATPGDAAGLRNYLDVVGKLGDVGVTWICVDAPHGSRAAYIDYVIWFGENVIAPLRRGAAN